MARTGRDVRRFVISRPPASPAHPSRKKLHVERLRHFLPIPDELRPIISKKRPPAVEKRLPTCPESPLGDFSQNCG
jgi:hypothetical protein